MRKAGILLVTNALEPTAYTEFEAWYARSICPTTWESAGSCGRRYRSTRAGRDSLALYETETPEVLRSPAYLERSLTPTSHAA
jgi:hypothetical protein